MNKKELVKAVSEKSELRKCQGESVINALMDVIGEELKHGKRLKLSGIGTFEIRERREREFVNPKTKKLSLIQEKKAPSFYASSTLKNKLRG